MTTKALVSVIPATFMLAGHAFAEPYRFVPIDVECPATAAASSCPAGLAPGQMAAQTSAKGINSGGDIVGSYIAVVGGPQHGFLLSHGQFSSLDFPMAGVRATVANGINARGEIVGQYLRSGARCQQPTAAGLAAVLPGRGESHGHQPRLHQGVSLLGRPLLDGDVSHHLRRK